MSVAPILIVGGLAVMWFGLCAAMIWSGWDDRYGGGWVMMGFGFVLGIVGIGLALVFLDGKDDPRILLSETEWACSKSDVVLTPMLVGKLIIQQPRTVCIQYTRKGRS